MINIPSAYFGIGQSIDPSALVSDKFGVRKLFIVGTKVGRVHALFTDSGKIAWSRYDPKRVVKFISLVRDVHVGVPPILAITYARTSSIQESSSFSNKDNVKMEVELVDAMTGLSVRKSMVVEGKMLQIGTLPVVEPKTHISLTAILTDDHEVSGMYF
jgi:hypothetical protein